MIATEGAEKYEITLRLEKQRASYPDIYSILGREVYNKEGKQLVHYSADSEVAFSDAQRASVLPLIWVCGRLSRTFYLGAYRNVLNTGGKVDYFDLQVGEAFVKRWRQMQAGDNRQENEACETVVAIIERLLGISRLQIQPSADDSTLQVSINRKAYKLTEVGSGIAQLILVLASAAMAKPAYILIDEPELNLHPSLQLEFLSELAKFAEHGVVFSTHSIGLARSCADRIFTVMPVGEGYSRVRPYEQTRNLPEMLGTLSYSSYQALGFDRVLMVEGVTEVKAIQQLLRKFKKDHRVLLLPLGDSQFICAGRDSELDDVKRISPNLRVVIDSEKNHEAEPLEKGRQAFVNTCQRLKIPCLVLQRRALENYFTDSAVKAVKGESFSALQPFEMLRKAKNGWSKGDNWRIAAEMAIEDFSHTDLGAFLQQL